MNIQFLGAARNVTGSKHLVTTDGGKKILLDCGFFQNRGKDNDLYNRSFKFIPSEIDYLILSHAHIDHSGNIPNLVKQGFKGEIFCTSATRDLCEVMLMDSAHIQQNDIEYINKKRKRHGEKKLEPIYTVTDVEPALKLFQTVETNKEYKLDAETSFHFTDAGHILGSVAVNLSFKRATDFLNLTFSGDIGRYHDLLLKAPQNFRQADYIICESTYGNRLHEHTTDARQKLFDVVVKTCLKKKGKLIIPAFSLGRTQEIIYTLDQFSTQKILPPVKVFVDSPLAINATDIMRKHKEYYNPEVLKYLQTDSDPFGFKNLFYIRDAEDSKKLNDLKEPCIIISASGMIEAGRIKHHVKNNIGDKRNTILMVGYCTPGSIGGRLMAHEKNVKIFGVEYEVKADVETISSYSAHADYEEIIKYLSCQDKSKIKTLFLVHGEYEVQKEFKSTLQKIGYDKIEIPDEGNVFELK